MSVVLTNNFPAFTSVVKQRASQFVTAAAATGSSYARAHAPIAYSNLVNSMAINYSVNGEHITATVGFYTTYAKYLEGTVEKPARWKPKPPPKYGNQKKGIAPAMAWNAAARPGFLRFGFENGPYKEKIDGLRKIFDF